VERTFAWLNQFRRLRVRSRRPKCRSLPPSASYDLWLDPGMSDVQVISELMKPYDARLMRCHPVSTRLNHVANDDEECSRPVEIANAQNRLFT
jgi:hypothetical protein